MRVAKQLGSGVTLVGNGPSRVAVIHGWLDGADSWAPFWLHVNEHRYTYAFVDLRGFGDRREEAGRFTVAEAADDVQAAVDVLGWSRFALIGHSMGGLIAQLVMHRLRDRVSALVGVCPVPASGSPLGPREPDFRRAVDVDAARAALFAGSTSQRHPVEWSQKMAEQSLASTSPAALHGYLTSWTGTDISADVAGMETPISVLVGEHDPAYPVSRIERTWSTTYPDVEIATVAGAGHYPMVENPAELARAVESFIERRATAFDADEGA